jgi:NAD(P)-dependent dehydrogenase (short-subunit alcohol dehydrogenase family)
VKDKTVVVTGATSGIGQVAALELARMGARVVFTARDANRGADMLARLREAGPTQTPALVVGDLSLIAGMRAAAEGVKAAAARIDVLINNAGAVFDRRDVTADGLERTFALNHMAYFVVTEALRPALAADARIVSTASGAHSFARLNFADLQAANGYQAMTAYANSKLCNILWTRELARRLAGTSVTANCLHPGAVSTRFGEEAKGFMGSLLRLARPLMLTAEKGADTLVWLAASPDVAGQSGGYWVKRKRVEPSAAARDDAAARRLWDESERIAGVFSSAA